MENKGSEEAEIAKTLSQSSGKKKRSMRKHPFAGVMAAVSSVVAKKESARLAKDYAKPKKFQRDLYDDGPAHYKAKLRASKSGTVKDPYTGAELEMRIQDAKMKYGSDSASHTQEADHIDTIKNIYNRAKNKAWVKNDDIKTAANRDDNYQVISRKINNAKRAKSNEQFFSDKEGLEAKGLEISEEARQEGIELGKKAERATNRQLRNDSIKNVAHESLKAGARGGLHVAATVACVSVVRNAVWVINGKKTVEEALKDIGKDSGLGFVSGFVTTSLIATIQHTFESSSNEFLQALAEKNVPEKVILSVAISIDLVYKWVKHEITAEEMITELGQRGFIMGAAAIGQANIPIPIIGAAVGSLIGSILEKMFYDDLVNEIKNGVKFSLNWVQAQKEAIKIRKESKAFRKEFLTNVEKYFPSASPSLTAPFKEMKYLPLPN